MTVMASRARYPIDAETTLRATGQAAVDESTNTDALTLERLTAYWENSQLSTDQELVVVVWVESIDVAELQAYTVAVEVDELAAFGSAIAIATATLSATGFYPIVISRDMIEIKDPDSGFLRVAMTADDAAAYQLGSVAFDDQPTAEDAVTIDDDTNAETFEFNNEVGTVVIAAGAVADGAIVTIDDGVNDPVSFEFDDNATVTAGNISVDPGADEAEGADNLAAAIEAQVTAGNLNVSAVSNSVDTVTITNHNNAAGSITEDADPGTDLTITDFAVTLDNVGATLVAIGHDLTETLANFIAAIEAGALNVTAAEVVSGTVDLVNQESQAGAITEVTDAGTVITVTDFEVAPLSIAFSAWVAPTR